MESRLDSTSWPFLLLLAAHQYRWFEISEQFKLVFVFFLQLVSNEQTKLKETQVTTIMHLTLHLTVCTRMLKKMFFLRKAGKLHVLRNLQYYFGCCVICQLHCFKIEQNVYEHFLSYCCHKAFFVLNGQHPLNRLLKKRWNVRGCWCCTSFLFFFFCPYWHLQLASGGQGHQLGACIHDTCRKNVDASLNTSFNTMVDSRFPEWQQLDIP